MVATDKNCPRQGQRFGDTPKVNRVSFLLTVLVWLLAGELWLGGGAWAEAEGRLQAVELAQSDFEKKARAEQLFQQGREQYDSSQFRGALQSWEAALGLYREVGDRQGEVDSLGSLGVAHYYLRQYERAINFLQQSLAIAQEISDSRGELMSFHSLGHTYRDLGQYEQAINFYQNALAIAREIGSHLDESASFNNLGNTYNALGQYERAIDFYQKSLAIVKEIGHRRGEASVLSNLGLAYDGLDQHERAIDLHQQSLSIDREIGYRRGEADSLHNLGVAHANHGNYEKGIENLQKAIALHRSLRDRLGEGIALRNFGKYFNKLDQPNLAITFYKASVNVRESIRDDIKGLDLTFQQSYTNTIADDYRALADLLLSQGRIPEAQQTLDLLKLEELREFTNTRATWTGSELQYTEIEHPVIDSHTDLIAFGQTLEDCKRNPDCDNLEQLLQQSKAITAQYNQQVQAFNATVRDNRHDDDIFQNPDNLSGDAKELLAANPDSVLIYPFITADKLWLLYATPGSVGTVEVSVSQAELSKTVQRLGSQLQSGNDLVALQATSKQLYDWLIQPLEDALQRNNIQHLIFVNDRVTRYIPMAALFDGQQYLIERYTVSSVIAPGVTDTEATLGTVNESNVLGLGLTQAVEGFNPLPAVATELDNVIRSDASDPNGIYPGQVHLNEAFTRDRLEKNLLRHNVLHIATHAAFIPGRAQESYIVLGDGDRLAVPDIDAMHERLSNLHLVVLSACQTALGGEANDGTEIAGLSAYFLKAGRAQTVIASLWSVNDDSTSLLMQRFYELLASGELTKAEALRQAQLSLLYEQDSATRLAATRASLEPVALGSRSASGRREPKHPFHWAPFILIGNGL